MPWIILQSVLTSDHFAKVADNARVTELAYVFGSNPKFCGFESHLEHQLAGSVNTFTDYRLKKCGVLSKGFLASKSKPISIPFSWPAVPFKSGEG